MPLTYSVDFHLFYDDFHLDTRHFQIYNPFSLFRSITNMTITPFQNRCYIAGFADQSLRFRQTKKLKYTQYCRFFIKAPNTHNRSLRFYWIHFTSTFQIHATIFATVCYKTKLLLIYALYLFVCLFWVYRPTREFFTHMETSPWPVKGCKCFDQCSALMAI